MLSNNQVETLAWEEVNRMDDGPKKVGRPKISEREKLKQFTLRLNDEERRFVEQHGGSHYVRRLLRVMMGREGKMSVNADKNS